MNPTLKKVLGEDHGEGDTTNPEENREVQIGNEIMLLARDLHTYVAGSREAEKLILGIWNLCTELTTMHAQDAPAAAAPQAEPPSGSRAGLGPDYRA